MTSVCVFWLTSLTWLFLLLLMSTVIFIYTQKCHEKSVLQNFNVKKFVVACLYIQINGTTTARKNTASNTKGIMNQHVAGALVEAIVLIVAEPWEWLAGEIFSLKFTKYRLAAGLCPDPLGELKRSPRPPSRNKGGLLLRGGDGRGGEGKGGEGEREGMGELAPRC